MRDAFSSVNCVRLAGVGEKPVHRDGLALGPGTIETDAQVVEQELDGHGPKSVPAVDRDGDGPGNAVAQFMGARADGCFQSERAPVHERDLQVCTSERIKRQSSDARLLY